MHCPYLESTTHELPLYVRCSSSNSGFSLSVQANVHVNGMWYVGSYCNTVDENLRGEVDIRECSLPHHLDSVAEGRGGAHCPTGPTVCSEVCNKYFSSLCMKQLLYTCTCTNVCTCTYMEYAHVHV